MLLVKQGPLWRKITFVHILALVQFVECISSLRTGHPLDLASRNHQPYHSDSTGADDNQIRFLRQRAADDRKIPVYGQRQCNVSIGERVDCGKEGIQKGACLRRGCCWQRTTQESVPRCYHSRPTQTSECTAVEDEERTQCGRDGIKINECLKQSCCWRPTETPGAPWCYNPKEPVLFNSDICGVPVISPNVNLRIIGGVDAVPNSWPWQVSLQANGRHFCGASLVNEQWIITAAHCDIRDRTSADGEIKAVVGVFNVKTMEPENFTVAIVWGQIFPSPAYSLSAIGIPHNDYMVIKLAEPVKFNDAVRPVCLATSNSTVKPSTLCYTTGWGSTTYGGQGAEKLQQVKMPILSNEVCDTKKGFEGTIDESMICAGYQEGGRSPCHGDSGGPLVCYENRRWVMYGIVSWGQICAGEDMPGVFARVSHGFDWIAETLIENSKN